MKGVLALLVLTVLAGGVVVWTKVIQAPEEGGPDRQGATSWEEEPKLPRLEMVELSLRDHAARDVDPGMTEEMADALHHLAADVGIALDQLNQLAMTDKLVIDAVNLLPGAPALSIEDVEAFAAEAELPEEATRTLSRDRMLSLEVLRALAKRGDFRPQDMSALETVAAARTVQTRGMSVVRPSAGGEPVVQTATELLECGPEERPEPLGAIQVFDQRGDVRVAWDEEKGRWIVPDQFGAPATLRRMKEVASMLDGLGRSRYVGKNPKKHVTFDLDGDEGPRVRLERQDGSVLLEFRVGKIQRTDGRSNAEAPTYIRPVGKDTVFLHPKNLNRGLVSSAPNAWVDARFFSLEYPEVNEELSRIESLTLTYEDEPLVENMPGGGDREWSGERVRYRFAAREKAADESEAPGPSQPVREDPTGAQTRRWEIVEPADVGVDLHTPLVDNMARYLLGGRGQEIVGSDPDEEKYGFAEPRLEITAQFSNGEVRTLKVGGEVAEEDAAETAGSMMRPAGAAYYVTVSGNPYVYRVPGVSMQNFMKSPEELVDPAARRSAAPGPGAAGREPRILTPEEAEKEKAEREKTEGPSSGAEPPASSDPKPPERN